MSDPIPTLDSLRPSPGFGDILTKIVINFQREARAKRDEVLRRRVMQIDGKMPTDEEIITHAHKFWYAHDPERWEYVTYRGWLLFRSRISYDSFKLEEFVRRFHVTGRE